MPFVLFIGAAMGITAFPVLARILAEHKLMHTRVAVFAISCAAVDDITAWCLLALITVVARPAANCIPPPLRFAALGLYILVMVFLIRPVLRRILRKRASGPQPFWRLHDPAASLSLDHRGLAVHALFGAFLAGVVMPKGGRLVAGFKDRLELITLVWLLPLFFAYTGLRPTSRC